MKSSLKRLRSEGLRYGTIFADPPWPETGAGKIKRGADRHYPLMKVSEIVAMAELVQNLAEPDSHLYLWATNNFLPQALEVLKAWGFRYKTAITWMKKGNPSEKPSIIYDMAGLVSPGPYLDLFGIRERPGWTV
jgi:N6-adenosine-specific RNA methylase IME4